MNRAGLLELIAGKTRSNTAAAILSNTEDLEEAYKSAMEAEGSALKENETYLDSIQGRIDQFTNALQTFWNNLLNSDIIKWFVTLGTKVLELASKFGELRSVIFVFLAYMSITKKWDFAKMFFGPKDVNVILKGLSKIKTMLSGIKSMFGGKNGASPLALMAPGLPPPADSATSAGGTPKTTPPSGSSGDYARLGASTEPLDPDKVYGSKFKHMWQNHMSRLRDSAHRVKQDLAGIWQHHNERVAQSMQYAGKQFDKLKIVAVQKSQSVAKTIGSVANNVRNSFVKATSKAWYEDDAGRAHRAKVLSGNLPDAYEPSEQSYSKIDEIITRIRANIDNTVQRGKVAFANLASSVSAQFNSIKNNVGNSIRDTFNNIVSNVKNAVSVASSSFKNIKSKFGRKSTTVALPAIEGAQSSDKTASNASRVAAEVGRIWKKHIANLKGNYSAIKDEITTIWSHHKIRVKESVAHAVKDFNKLKVNFSKAFGVISTKVHNVGATFKAKFGDAFKHVQSGFSKFGNFVGNIFNKIKTSANNTAKAFKESLGYKQESATQGASATVDPTAWLNAGSQLGNAPLVMGNDAAAKIDAINNAMKDGQVALNGYMSGLGDTDKALQAYIASLNGGKASVAGFNSFIKTHNAGLKASGVAARIAAIGHQALNIAMSMGLSILIQFVMEGLMKLIDYLKNVINPTEKLAEDISDLKSEIQNTESEIESINDELDTCRDRMAELLALPTLSFVEQEELSNLQKEIALLERKLALEEALLEREEAKLVTDTGEYITEAWNEQGTYNVKNFEKNKGVIRKDKGWSGFWDDSKTTAEVLDESMAIYRERDSAIADAENVLLNFESSSKKERREALKALNIDDDDLAGDISIFDKNKALSGDAEAFEKAIEAAKSVNMEVAKSIDSVFNDPQYAGLTYGMSDDIDAFLDEFYAYQNKWNVMLGQASKSDDIASLFDATASKEMQALGTQLKEIADDESLSIDQQNEKIKGLIGEIDLENEAYRRLKSTMDIVGVTAQDIADYFTLETGVFDSDTIEGITAQYTKASNVMKELQNMGSDGTFTIDGTAYNWDEFFSEDDTGKFKARADKFAEILKGMDKNTRETFMSISEQVKNESISWDDAIKSFNLSGLVEASKLIEKQFSELNKSVFKGLEDELSGFIDKFSELSAALEDVAGSMDLLKSAEQQMNSSGRVSIKTALELIESTDRWNEVLTIENGKVTLNANAEDVLVQSKLNVIKANIQEALSSARLQLAQLGTANATLVSAEASDVTSEAYAIYTDAMNTYSASIAGFGAAIGELLDDDGDWDIAGAFKSAYDAALVVKDHEATVASEDLTQKIADLEAQAKMLEQIDTSSEFKNYYDYNKTPGDKYGGDLDGNGYEDEDGFLDSLRGKYERKIENLDNQQTYLQNEIDRLEAENKAVSKSYYEEQIALEEDKLALYEQERQALLKLKMTDEVAAALWETEHAIQESTMRMVEFRQSIVDLYVEAFDKVIGAYDNSDDFYSDQQNYIDKYQELMELQGKTVTAGGIQEQIALEEKKMADNVAELTTLRQGLADAMEAGYIEEGSEEWVEYQDKIRAAEEAILDNKIAIEQYREELKQLSVDAFETVREAFGNKDNFLSNQQDYIQGYADLLEAYGVDVPAAVYQKLIDIEGQRRENFVKDLADSKNGLDKLATTLLNNAVKSNPEMESWTDQQKQAWLFTQKEYVDAYNTMTETEGKIQDCDIATAEWIKTMRELSFEKFDRFIDRLNDIHSEMDNIRTLFEDDDVANEDGTWTKKGITSLGLAVQQMEESKQKSNQYANEIAYAEGLRDNPLSKESFDAQSQSLKDQYDSGAISLDEYNSGLEDLTKAYGISTMSEQEYYDYMQKLKDGQWDSIKAYEDAKDAIIDMEEARIDMIEKGLNEEIEAYQELTETKKEELDAERDLYDFKKKVKDQTKDIAELDRRIASLSGSTADADIAELRKLKKERAELQEGLDDTYYQHSKDSQSKALDDELENFQKIREDYVEELRETLEDTATVIAEKMAEVLANADIVHDGIKDTAEEYGVPISGALIAPWDAAKDKATEFKNTASDSVSSLINEDGIITLFGSDETKAKVTGVFGAGTSASDAFKQAVESDVGAIKTVVENSTSGLTSNLGYPWEETTKEGGPIATFDKDASDAITDAVGLATEKAQGMYDQLAKPWLDMTADDGPLNTFSSDVDAALNDAEERARQHVTTVNSTYSGIKYPDYAPPIYGGSGNGTENKPTNTPNVQAKDQRVQALQEILNGLFFSGLEEDGIFGTATKNALRNAQKNMGVSQSGKYDDRTRSSMITYVDGIISRATKDRINTSRFQDIKAKIRNLPAFAKGTLGTKKDQLAITDESWIGEEITLAAGKNGQLQYLKKGSAVMPSDISANLVEWGKLNPNMMAMANASQGINLMSNYVNKPELNLSFEALVKAGSITQDTLPAVKKLVTEELDKFTRKLNYAIKRA